MKTIQVRITFGRSRVWLAAVIGILGIIGGARQQVWAGSSFPIPQQIEPPLGAPASCRQV